MPGRPVGFDGRLTAEGFAGLVQALAAGSAAGSPGYEVGAGYPGTVAVVTSIGSCLVPVAAAGGRLPLGDVLMARPEGDWAAGSAGTALIELIWNVIDLARTSPIYLYWTGAGGLHRAELRGGPGLAAAIWSVLRARG